MSGPALKPDEETIAMVGGEIAVGEDLPFQRRWWRFERIAWGTFALLLALDLVGVFGRGPLARRHRSTADGAMEVRYEAVERTGAPSMLEVTFAASAVEDGKVHLFMSDSLVRELGATRVIPQPETTSVGQGGLTYDFPVTGAPARVTFALQPPGAGLFPLTLRTGRSAPLALSIFVMP